MANIYVRSTDGSNADNGSTWALAKADLTGAAAIDAAGDTIWISHNHAETTAGTIAFNLAGTRASPVRVLCGNDGAEPPTTLATSATISTTGSANIAFQSASMFYVYGITFQGGDSTGSSLFSMYGGTGTGLFMFENCGFVLRGSSSTSRIRVANNSHVTWKNCDVKFANASQALSSGGALARFLWEKGSILSGTTAPTYLFACDTGMQVEVNGVDLSEGGSSLVLVSGNSHPGHFIFRNCKLPASWSGSLITFVTFPSALRVEMYNCDSGDTNYRLWVEDTYGSCKSETTIVRSGARTDGTTNVSWKVTTGTDAQYASNLVRCPDIFVWNETTGSSVTVKIPFVHDDATDAKTNEIGMDIFYAGTSGFPLYLLASTDESVLASFASHADATSDDNWGSTGFSNENEQRMSLSFTPQEKGFIIIRVKVYEASKTIYIDPDPQIS